MEFLRHLPTESPENLAELIQCRPGQVVSMSLYQSGDVQMTLLAFDGGEGVSEEHYVSAGRGEDDPEDRFCKTPDGTGTGLYGSRWGAPFPERGDSLQAPANHGKAVTYQEADYEVYHKTWRNQDGKTD